MRDDTFEHSLAALRPAIEARYPLELGRVFREPIAGDDGWRVDYRIEADLRGALTLLDLVGVEQWIRDATGVGVLIDARSTDALIDAWPGAAAAE